MTTDSFLALTCTASLGLLFGFILAFAGYRFFVFLLPFWGFFWGFGLGAQSIQAIFGEGFLSSITSWVVGFFLGLVFAVLSYFFFAAAVAILAGSLGYSVGTGIMLAIGFDMGFLTWIVGIALAILFVLGVFYLDLYKWAIIISTSLLGAGVVVGTFLFIFGKLPSSQFVANPVKAALNDNPLWWIVGIVIAILGFVAQYQSTRNWTLKSYSRWEEVYPGADTATPPPGQADLPATPTGTTSVGMTPAMAGMPGSGGAPSTPPPPPADMPPVQDTSNEPPPDRSA
jgi:hypothetical protein